MTTLPQGFHDWFAARGWTLHAHQRAMLDRADEPSTLLIAPILLVVSIMALVALFVRRKRDG